MGRQNTHNSSNIVPVEVWTAKPSQKYEVALVQRFFVSTGTYTEGSAVNVADLGQIVTFDFTTEYNYTAPAYSRDEQST